MRTMYDGINSDAAAIHKAFPRAELVAGYVNGRRSAWTADEWNLFPHAAHVTITVTAAANAGDVLDVEGGDATPAQSHDWIAMRKRAGLYRPTVYCSLSAVPAVRAGTREFVLGRDYDLWVADYDGSTASVYELAAAKQDRSTASYDVSAVYDDGWPHRHAPVQGAWAFGRVRRLAARPGHASVALTWDAPDVFDGVPPVPAPGIAAYEIAGSKGPRLTTEAASYPRFVPKGANPQVHQVGSLRPGTQYTAGVRAMLGDGSHSSPWATVTFRTG